MTQLSDRDQFLVDICSKTTAQLQQSRRERAMTALKRRYTIAQLVELTGYSHCTVAKFCKARK
jgi:hypothetical protein